MVTPEENNDRATTADGNGWCPRHNADTIPCPALLSFYNNGWLKPDENGNVSTADLDKVLASVGLSATVRKILVKGADESDNVLDGKFNLFALRDSKLDHTGSTGVRDPKVNPELLESNVLQFSENGRMYAKHFAAVANHARKQDPGLKGTITQTVELTALLEVFGREDESKNRYLTVDDVRGLWIDGKFPKDWQPHAPDEIGAAGVTLRVAEMVLKRVLKDIGF